ncbi:MAG: Uncharacterised protein [Polaribacter sp. SA4-10]|jgi:hypothetical protein|nr:MAG: Uncharacterised protein [Polaribacter sp. SA4-10]
MWGANKWTDAMFKKYGWAVLVLGAMIIIAKLLN